MTFDVIVCIGRFEPFALAHLALLQHALARAPRVVALVGSSETPASPRHPWTFLERARMIEAALGPDAPRVVATPLRDHLYNEHAWLAEAQARVASFAKDAGNVALLGAGREYANAFPQWARVDFTPPPSPSNEDFRRWLFSDAPGAERLIEANVPAPVFEIIDAYRRSEAFARAREEFLSIEKFRADWSSAPYPPIFVTVDAVVRHSGHVLLVKRRNPPGRGLWALPGGFVEADEYLRDAAIRELREETGLDASAGDFLSALRAQQTFDRPDRSQRGRTITHAFFFDTPSGELPRVCGGDDAAAARWIPISRLSNMRAAMFEDHFHILEFFLGAI